MGGAVAQRPKSLEPVARAVPPVPYLHPALELHAAVLTDLQELLPWLRDVRVCTEICNGLVAWETAWHTLQLQLHELEGRRQVQNGVDAPWLQALLELKDQHVRCHEAHDRQNGGSTGGSPRGGGHKRFFFVGGGGGLHWAGS